MYSNMYSLSVKPNGNSNVQYNQEFYTDPQDNLDILTVNLDSINTSRSGLELALSVLRLSSTKFNSMTKQQVIRFYNEQNQLNLSNQTKTALNIILKTKLRDSDGPIVLQNPIVLQQSQTPQNQLQSQKYSNLDFITQSNTSTQSYLNLQPAYIQQQQSYVVQQNQSNNSTFRPVQQQMYTQNPQIDNRTIVNGSNEFDLSSSMNIE